MRKVLFSILVAFYLILTSGVVVHLHYCMDRLAAVGLFASDHKDACDDCGMDMTEENDCCHDRTDVIKLKQDQTAHSSLVANFKKAQAEPLSILPNTVSIPLTKVQHGLLYLPSDPISGRYRYRLIEVFRI
ncbi:MAG: HYC_CC_PP family protein [Bacteroidota bacterium]|jgi:hypothetical protein